ncbi:hypothetical protein GCM10028796_25220 [Ramlibacter monticola]|nr:hypothetical protein [Ramlibacter monticola]
MADEQQKTPEPSSARAQVGSQPGNRQPERRSVADPRAVAATVAR